LDDLPFLRKYGIPPQDESGKPDAGNPKAVTAKSSSPGKDMEDDSDDDSSDSSESSANRPPVVKPQIDKRPIKFLKGKVVSVDCSEAPVAVVVISGGKKTLKLRAADYNSVAILGSDKFSCGWKELAVNVNYRAGGKLDGDLVSVEVQ
jgi:hypothetical protein